MEKFLIFLLLKIEEELWSKFKLRKFRNFLNKMLKKANKEGIKVTQMIEILINIL
jgi:hypothetical protein